MTPTRRSQASTALRLRAQERAEIARRAPERPADATTALAHLRAARLELMAAYRITAAAGVEAIIRDLEKGS